MTYELYICLKFLFWSMTFVLSTTVQDTTSYYYSLSKRIILSITATEYSTVLCAQHYIDSCFTSCQQMNLPDFLIKYSLTKYFSFCHVFMYSQFCTVSGCPFAWFFYQPRIYQAFQYGQIAVSKSGWRSSSIIVDHVHVLSSAVVRYCSFSAWDLWKVCTSMTVKYERTNAKEVHSIIQFYFFKQKKVFVVSICSFYWNIAVI